MLKMKLLNNMIQVFLRKFEELCYIHLDEINYEQDLD